MIQIHVTLLILDIMVLLIFLILNISYFNFKQFILSLIFQMIILITWSSIWTDSIVSMVFTIVTMYYENMRIDKVNKLIDNVDHYNRDQLQRAIDQYIEQHNRYCTHIWTINELFKIIYLAFLIAYIPINLLLLHQVLFQSLTITIRLLLISCIFGNDFILFGLQYEFALLSAKVHKMCSKVSRLQWSLNGYPFRMRTKLKILMCFERLSAKDKIGIAVANNTMTLTLFSMVSIFILL